MLLAGTINFRLQAPPLPFTAPSTCDTCKQKIHQPISLSPKPPSSLYWNELDYLRRFEAPKSDHILKVFWSALLCSLFWNTFFFCPVITLPPPNEYKPSWNPLRSCISPGLLIGSLQYVDKAPNIINRAKSELLDAEQNSWNKWRHLPGVISLAKQKCRQCIYFENSEVLFWNSGKIQIAFIFHQSK